MAAPGGGTLSTLKQTESPGASQSRNPGEPRTLAHAGYRWRTYAGGVAPRATQPRPSSLAFRARRRLRRRRGRGRGRRRGRGRTPAKRQPTEEVRS